MNAPDDALGFLRGYNLYIREYGNGIAAPLCAVLVYVLGTFLWRNYRGSNSWSEFHKQPGIATACLLWWLLVAEGLRALNAYIPLAAGNAKRPLTQLQLDLVSLGFAIGIAVLVAVLVRSIFEFEAPSRIPITLALSVTLVTAFLLWGSFLGP